MSVGYAEKLSYRDDIGAVGQRELLDSDDEVQAKCDAIADLIGGAKRLVVLTGAGISTAAGIPDFRGPDGVWTCQKEGKPLPKLNTTFVAAQPTLTHMALVALAEQGPLQYLVSQNVDSLHRRSGVPAGRLAEVHGNCFMERCPSCQTYYLRDFEMGTVGFQTTGRSCTRRRCRGRLRDFILDWEDALPDEELERAEREADTADVIVCLGTSLQITPICDLPVRTRKRGGACAIVNLQRTPKDKHADVLVHARSDDVMRRVMRRLRLRVPPFVRHDRFALRYWIEDAQGAQDAPVLVLALSSVHGMTSPLPLLRSVQCAFAGLQSALPCLPALGDGRHGNAAPPTNRNDGDRNTEALEQPEVKRRKVHAPEPEILQLGENKSTHWQVESISTVGLPILLRVQCSGDTQLPAPLFARLGVQLTDEADKELQLQQLTLQLAADCGDVARCGCSMPLQQAWEAAASYALELQLMTQVQVYEESDVRGAVQLSVATEFCESPLIELIHAELL